MKKLDMNSEFFLLNKTDNLFPYLKYNGDNIPLGNSIDFCIGASWAPKESKKIKTKILKNKAKIKTLLKSNL
jgi:hypothetical protein